MVRHLVSIAGLLLLAVFVSEVWADRAYSVRYSVNQNGDLTQIGNTILTCDEFNPALNYILCATARSGGNYSNNDFDMINVDIDADGSTFNSSNATLSLPAGSTVTFAGLYWGAMSSNAARDRILLMTPGSSGYSQVIASVVDTNNDSTLGYTSYHSFADITSVVAAAGSGTYTVANIQAILGNNLHGGWALVVVYQDNSLPLRNFTVFDGFDSVREFNLNFSVSGFLTPLNGPITSNIGFVAYDGDRDVTNDSLTVNGTAISDGSNPVNNAYNSTISSLGVRYSAKSPDYVNQLGYDADRISIPQGIIPNGATSANFTMSGGSTAERIWPGVFTFTTDLYVPVITPNVVKTATDLNGGTLLAGDILRWNISLGNTGYDTATSLVLTDNIPANVTYSSDSLVVASGTNNGAKSDASGDDQAEYISSGTPRVVYRLGTGANATNGGSLANGEFTSVQFDTVVNSGLPSGTELSNAASVAYNGQTIGDTFSTTSALAVAVVMVPPSITKSFSPNPVAVNTESTLSIVVSNPATNPNTLTGVTFSDTYPAGLVNSTTPSPQVSCTAGSTAGTITGGVAGGNTIGMSPGATLLTNGYCTITVDVESAAENNYTNTTDPVASTNGGTGSTASATLSVGKPGITKVFAPASILSGAVSTITFTLDNQGAVPLTDVTFSDTLTNMVVAATPNVVNNCGGTVTATAGAGVISLGSGSLAASSSCTLSVDVSSSVTGIHPNVTSGVTSAETPVAGNPSNTVSLTVVGSPVATKSFSPTSVATNTPSVLTITISNPNTTTTMTGVSFTDTYPLNLINSTPASPTINCTAGSSGTRTGGANGSNTIGMSGGTLLAGGSCTLTVNLQSGTAANYNNSTGSITSTDAGTGSAASATLNVTALTSVTVAKTFLTTPIAVNGTTTMRIRFTNPNAGSGISGIAFADTYPANLVNASPLTLTNGCGGTATASAGGNSLSLSGGSIAAGAGTFCDVTVVVTSADTSTYTNSTGLITTINAGTSGPVTGVLEVLAPPVISKAFSVDAISIASAGSNNESRLTITLSNPTSATTSLTGVAVTDEFPGTLVVDNPLNTGNTCGGTYQGRNGGGDVWGAIAINDNQIRITGVTLAPNASCSFYVDVSSATAGLFPNATFNVSSTNGGNGLTASATLTVGQPDINKTFITNPVASGVSTQLRLTLINPTAAAMGTASVTDALPAGMVVAATPAATNGCGGTFEGSTDNVSYHVIAAGDTYVRLTGGTIPASGNCQLNVNVTSTVTNTNTIPAGGLVAGGSSNGVPGTATLVVYTKPGVTKTFTPLTVLPGVSSNLKIVLTNSNTIASGNLSFTDSFPAGLVVAGAPAWTNTCGGTFQGSTDNVSYHAIVAGDSYLRLNGVASIPANGSCQITANVTSSTANSYPNSTGPVTTASIGTGDASTATLVVMGPPVVAKQFSPDTISLNDTSALTITLTNNNDVDITGAAFTDNYPLGMINAVVANAGTSCAGGVVTGVPGASSLSLSGATIPANSSCTVTVNVTSSLEGIYVNGTGPVTTTNAGTGSSASDTLNVAAQPVLVIVKTADLSSASPGGDINYTLSVSNTGDGVAKTVVINDDLSVFAALGLDTFGAGVPFLIVQGSPSSTLILGVPAYSNNDGATYLYTPVSGGGGMPAGFDGDVTNFDLPLTGNMPAGSSFDLKYTVKVK